MKPWTKFPGSLGVAKLILSCHNNRLRDGRLELHNAGKSNKNKRKEVREPTTYTYTDRREKEIIENILFYINCQSHEETDKHPKTM